MRALVLLSLLLSVPAGAQASGDTTAEELPSVIVMNFARGADVPVDVPHTLSGLLTAALAKEKRLRFVSGSELAQLMELEGQKARVGCEDDSCMADIAGALGARFAVGGSITQLGELQVLQLRLMDVHSAEGLSRVTRNAQTVEAFVPLMDEMAAELLAPALARVASERGESLGPLDNSTAVERPVNDDQGQPDGENGSFLLSASLIGGGVALIGVAAVAAVGVTAVDIAMIAFVNPSLGPEDALAPLVYVGAAVLAAGGLGLCLTPLLLGDDEEGT